MKNISIFLLTTSLISSCSKDLIREPDKKKELINVGISFIQSTTKSVTVTEYDLFIFDTNGELISKSDSWLEFDNALSENKSTGIAHAQFPKTTDTVQIYMVFNSPEKLKHIYHLDDLFRSVVSVEADITERPNRPFNDMLIGTTNIVLSDQDNDTIATEIELKRVQAKAEFEISFKKSTGEDYSLGSFNKLSYKILSPSKSFIVSTNEREPNDTIANQTLVSIPENKFDAGKNEGVVFEASVLLFENNFAEESNITNLVDYIKQKPNDCTLFELDCSLVRDEYSKSFILPIGGIYNATPSDASQQSFSYSIKRGINYKYKIEINYDDYETPDYTRSGLDIDSFNQGISITQEIVE